MGGSITVFVFNISVTVHWKGLWTLFSYHGKVVNAFIPEKTSRNGKRFGFVRFSNFLDAQRAISRLNGFVILGNRIWVNIARFNGRRVTWRNATSQRNSSSFKEPSQKGVVDELRGKEVQEHMDVAWKAKRFERELGSGSGGEGMNIGKVVQGHVEDEQLWKLQKCLVGEVASFCELKSLADRVAGIGLGEIREFFIHIAPWSEKLVFTERNYETFKRITGKWGTLVSMGENWSGANNFEKVEMLISISQVQKLDEIVLLEVGEVRFPVSIREKGCIGGQHLNGGCIPDANKISPNISEVPETEGQVFCQEIEEEFLNAIRSRRKKKHFNKRICSMQDIQDKVLSSKEKLRRDRGKKKDKSKATLGEEKIVNISLSDSDISNRRKMKIVSWYVRVLGSDVKVTMVNRLVKLHREDVCFLQETKLEEVSGDLFCINRLIVVEGFWCVEGWEAALINVYAPNMLREQKIFWEEMIKIREQFTKHWIVGGDFNANRNKSVRSDCVGLLRGLKEFGNFLEKCLLVDLRLLGKKIYLVQPSK
ncbi:hypothetical protein V6Z11_A10G084700 [Gossypium hirsutum]